MELFSIRIQRTFQLVSTDILQITLTFTFQNGDTSRKWC